MKRLALPVLLVFGFAGNAAAQGPEDVFTLLNNVDGAVNNLVPNAQGTATTLLNGSATGSGEGLNATLGCLATDLAVGTPGEPLAAALSDGGDQLVAAAQPLTSALDGPAGQLAAAGAPLADPAKAAINSVEVDVSLQFNQPALPGGGAGLPGLPSLPGTGGLPVGDLPLPLDQLDPSTLTALLGGASLPGL